MNKIKLISKFTFLFIVGGLLYNIIEILYRGYTHISMYYLGGICFILCGLENEVFEWDTPIEVQMVISSIIITVLELLTGIIVNIILGLNVWDYSNMPFNLWGQICLPFTFMWMFLSIPAIILDDYLRYKLFHEEKPRYSSLLLPNL